MRPSEPSIRVATAMMGVLATGEKARLDTLMPLSRTLAQASSNCL